MEYQYRARTFKGELEGGRIEAPSKEVALDILRKKNLIVTFLEEIEIEKKKKRIFFRPKIKAEDLSFLFRQLALLISAGVTLPEAIRSVAHQTGKKVFRSQLLDIAHDIEGGSYLSKALSALPETFSSFIVNMIRTGELTGNLRKIFEYLSDHMERQQLVNARVKGALYYPLFIIGVAIVVILILFIFVLPRMGEMFESLEVQFTLPLPTRILLSVGNFFGDYGWVLIIILILMSGLLWRYSLTESGIALKDKLMLRLPIFGFIIQQIHLAALSENLGTLLKGGIPIAQALDTVGTVVGNTQYANVLFNARDGVRRGETLTSSFARFEIIPDTFIQLISAGEKSGRLGEILMDVAQFYETQVETTVNNLTNLLSPVLISVIGAGVAFVAISIIMPIYQMVGALTQ